MDFGKLKSLKGVDFTLPQDHPDTKSFLGRVGKESEEKRFYFACPAWNEKGFVGRIFPVGTPQKEFLRHYARHFSSIELNSTYYQVNRNNILKWKDTVGEEFRFCPKISREISHYRQLRNVGHATDAFFDAISLFEERLGPCFLLLPPHFSPKQFTTLQAFLEHFPKGFPLAVELRHADWYNDEVVKKEVFDLFEQTGTISLITDVAGRRDVLHQRLTDRTLIVRFVGNSLDPTDFSRLGDWVEKLYQWYSDGLETVYFFLHQPQEYLNVDIARHLIGKLNDRMGWNLAAPRLVEQQGQLF